MAEETTDRRSQAQQVQRPPASKWVPPKLSLSEPASPRHDAPEGMEASVWSRLSMHEFLVDFLGGLVPGVLFLAAGIFAVVPALGAVVQLASGDARPLDLAIGIAALLEATKGTPSTIWIGLFVLGLMLSYVLGLLFYRRDPKIPDMVSLERLLRAAAASRSEKVRAKARGLSRWTRFKLYVACHSMVQREYEPLRQKYERDDHVAKPWEELSVDERTARKKEMGKRFADPGMRAYWVPPPWRKLAQTVWLIRGPVDKEVLREPESRLRQADDTTRAELMITNDRAWKEFACCGPAECEFPYPHLSEYLKERNHYHLLETAESWEQARSKTHINRLKIRLSYQRPEKYRPVVRNEAHVRLATSTWYMAQTLRKATWAILACLGLVGVLGASTQILPLAELWKWLLAPSIPSALVMGVAYMSRQNCEQFIHYQRLREAFYVLELAYTATHPRVAILEPPGAPRK